MPKVIVDGTEIEVENGTTLMQACEMAGAEIPRFCFHERLSVAGNCRMCLVEVKGAPKPQASCAMSVNDLRPGPNGEPAEILTNSATVKKAREGVMEFLLINHPLDCPICDQGGECDLQDQAMAYGIDKNRFHENKRAVEDKYIGPLVKTVMTRCIQCTRCVRFTTEIGGVQELGAIGRGEDMEITTYLEKAMTSEMQGNVIDLCPVGALTSAPYEFKARPWELRKTETIDVMDGLGSAIRVDARGSEVLRIVPRLNEDVNEEWISDKTRFIWDGLKSQRLDRPYIRKNGKLIEATWAEALKMVADRVTGSGPEKTAALIGALAAVEESFALKELLTALDMKNLDCRAAGSTLGNKGGRAGYLFNAGIAGIEQADAIVLIGSNPRIEAAVLNARICQHKRHTDIPIFLIGEEADLTYDYKYLGNEPQVLSELMDGKGPHARKLKAAKRPMFIIGQGAIARPDGAAILSLTAQLASIYGALRQSWNGFCVLHDRAGQVGALDIGAYPQNSGQNSGMNTGKILKAAKSGAIDTLFLLHEDDIDMQALGDCFVIYQGSHGDAGAMRADIVLPGCAYTEKTASWVNTEGRVQMAMRAAFPPGEAREDWAILRAIAGQLGVDPGFATVDQLRAKIYQIWPHMAQLGAVETTNVEDLSELTKAGGKLGKQVFTSSVKDFYFTNPVARASRVMADCSALRAGHKLAAAE